MSFQCLLFLADLELLFALISPKMVYCLKSQADVAKEALVLSDKKASIVQFDGDSDSLETFIKDHKGTEINFRYVNEWISLRQHS